MADRKKMEGHCSTGQSPRWAVVPMEEEEEEEYNSDDEQPLFYCRALDGWCCNRDRECLLRGRK